MSILRPFFCTGPAGTSICYIHFTSVCLGTSILYIQFTSILPGKMDVETDVPVGPHSGSWFCNAWRLGGPCGQKYTQLMLMTLPSCLVKCAQSHVQLVFATPGI